MICKKCDTQNSSNNIYCSQCGAKLFIKAPKRGFASMSLEKRRAIASKGGVTAHKLGRAHRYTHEEAIAAGKIGGRAKKKTT